MNGTSVIAEGFRRGFHVLETVTDGDCGLDCLTVADGTARNLQSRVALRLAIRGVLIANAGNTAWADVLAATQEAGAPMANGRGQAKREPPLARGSGQAASASCGRGSGAGLPAQKAPVLPAPAAAAEHKGSGGTVGDAPMPAASAAEPNGSSCDVPVPPTDSALAMRRCGGPRACQTLRRRWCGGCAPSCRLTKRQTWCGGTRVARW